MSTINATDRVALLWDDGQDSSDLEDATSRILWIDEVGYTRIQLKDSLKREEEVHSFLQNFTILWPESNCSMYEWILRLCIYTVTRLNLIACPILIAINVVRYLVAAATRDDVSIDFSAWILDCIFISQAISIVMSLMTINRRLTSISSELEVSFFGNSVRYCVQFFMLSLFPSILYPIYHLLITGENDSMMYFVIYSLLPFCELSVLIFLSVHLLFIMVDVQVLAANFHELTSTHNQQTLSRQQSHRIQIVLNEIHFRVKSALCDSAPIILTALLEIVVIIIWAYEDFWARNFLPMLLIIFLFLKEIIFLVSILIMFSYCAIKRCFMNSKKKE